MRFRIVGFALEGRANPAVRVVPFAARAQQRGEVTCCPRVRRLERDRAIERADGSVAIATGFEADAEIEMRSRMERSGSDGLPVARDGLGETPRILLCVAASDQPVGFVVRRSRTAWRFCARHPPDYRR